MFTFLSMCRVDKLLQERLKIVCLGDIMTWLALDCLTSAFLTRAASGSPTVCLLRLPCAIHHLKMWFFQFQVMCIYLAINQRSELACVDWMTAFVLVLKSDGPVALKSFDRISASESHHIQTHTTSPKLLISDLKMKYAEEKPRLHKLLSSAITLLCKNGLGLADLPFSVEGLIGISVNEEDVMYLSFKETVTPDEELSVLVQQQDSNCRNEVESGGSCTWDDVDYILNHDDQQQEESFNMPSLENVCVKPVEPKLSQKPQVRKKPRRRKKTICQVQSVKLEKVSETKDDGQENSCLNKSFTSGVIKTEVNESGDNFGSLGVGGKLSRRKAYIPTRCPETDAPFDQSFDGTVKSEWNDVDFKVVGTLEIQSDLTSSVPQAVYTSSQYSSNSGASQKKSRKRARQSNKYSPQKSQVHKSACVDDHDAAISQLFPFLPDQHRPVVIPPTVTQFAPKKRCRICYSKKVRKEVRYCCFGCEDRPGLCLDPCFYEYHHLRGKILAKEEQDGTGSDEYLSPNDFKATDDNYQSVDIPKQESMCSETEENPTANHVVTEEYGNNHSPPDVKTSQVYQEAQSFISEDNLNGWPRFPDFEDPTSRASHVQFLDNS